MHLYTHLSGAFWFCLCFSVGDQTQGLLHPKQVFFHSVMSLTPVASPPVSWLISREAFWFKRNNPWGKQRERSQCVGFPISRVTELTPEISATHESIVKAHFLTQFVNKCLSIAHFILFGWLWAGIVLRLRMWIITDQQITKSKQTNTKHKQFFFFKIILKICWTWNWGKKFFTLNYTCKTKK